MKWKPRSQPATIEAEHAEGVRHDQLMREFQVATQLVCATCSQFVREHAEMFGIKKQGN